MKTLEATKYFDRDIIKSCKEINGGDEISDLFPSDLARYYRVGVEAKHRRALVEGYRNTSRWVNGDNNCDYPPGFKENDLDHVKELLGWLNVLSEESPNLIEEIAEGDSEELNELRLMLAVHDIGETIAGDVTADSSPEFKANYKKFEAKAGRRLIMLIHNFSVRSRLLACLERFENKNKSDKLVQFGHLLDKLTAAIKVAEVIAPYNFYSNSSFKQKLAEIVNKSIGFPLEYSDNLAKLISKQSRESIREIIEHELFEKYQQIPDSRVQETIQLAKEISPTFKL
ncbi:HD domain-containing protein [Candidatus Peregrinibacteria bacterium]|nr:HD domain-containing protein [Candidatus Peregrinibacteria bacterium]